jgi:hypothetical protein
LAFLIVALKLALAHPHQQLEVVEVIPVAENPV